MALSSQACVCGLPVIAFCLKKEILLRKKPITRGPRRQLYLSLLLPAPVCMFQWEEHGSSQGSTHAQKPAPSATPAAPFPWRPHRGFCYRKALSCVENLERSHAVPEPHLSGSKALLALLHLLPDLGSHFSVWSSHLILSQT